MPQEPFSRPQPQYWIEFLDPWVHDFYPAPGWGLATSKEERHSSQTQRWIKIGLRILGSINPPSVQLDILYMLVCCFSCLYLAHLGLRPLGLPDPCTSAQFNRSEPFQLRFRFLKWFRRSGSAVGSPKTVPTARFLGLPAFLGHVHLEC